MTTYPKGPLAVDSDPRGPIRRIASVSGDFKQVVTLDCGHVPDLNPTFTYRAGDEGRCFACGPMANVKGNR